MRQLNRSAFIILFIAISLGSMTCSSGNLRYANLVASDISRDTSPNVEPGDINALVKANTEFAFDLFHNLVEPDKNLFFSPFSITQVLTMTWAGAAGETQSQMADVMHYSDGVSKIYECANKLDLMMNSQKSVKLDVANSIWAQKDYPWKNEFLDLIKTNYGAGIFEADFVGNKEGTLESANAWVSRQTRGKFKNAIEPSIIDDLTVMLLLNTIYFNGEWKNKFKKTKTKKEDFYCLDGRTVSVPMMNLKKTELNGARTEEYMAVEMPYKGSDIAFLAVMPMRKIDTVDLEKLFLEFEESLTQEKLDEIVKSLHKTETEVSFPRIELNYEAELEKTLSDMGMTDAFVWGAADFSGMADTNELFISHVVHKTCTRIDEEGTIAIAFSSLNMVKSRPFRFKANRPFVFFIRDRRTGTVLFMGRVIDPTLG